ncbi:hypothetical protein TSUD_394630 [Trifolium subterraneum]|uniref:Reverse transcriptase domain-containing protein n=1 Tax=Trifolium subterraneum TaxID=3900 RepID=A0A2Z6NYH6_TRISU|nr:hypothetical protein TSUD_394630 [Trifolium subterraneum]
MWNGRRLPSFTPTKGLRQGDPLSPYLFVLCMEFLSHIIIKNIDDGLWKPVRLSRNGPPLFHLFFADDVLLFAKATKSQALIIGSTLKRFADYLGLKVNITKSKVFFSSTIRRGKISSIVASTNINRTLSLEKYPGFPMMHGRLQRRDFEFLEEKISKLLASWQHNLLNKAGLHLVGWDKITKPKKLGGLVFKQKYIKEEILLNTTKKPGSVTWNTIMKALSALREGFHFLLGVGNSSLWFTNWSGNGKLANQVIFVDIHDLEMRVRDVYIDACTYPSVNDCYTWKGNLNGIYTARDEKLKFFLWTMIHNSLPTSEMLSHRGILQGNLCPRCNTLAETTLHCLRDCDFVQIIWKSIGFSDLNFFQEDDSYDWLRNGLSFPSMFIFLAAVWWIWRARNALCLNSELIPLFALKLRIMDYALLLRNCQSNLHETSIPKLVKWNAGGTDMILNVEGSSIGNPGIYGFGGLIRNADGACVHGFFGNLGVTNILHAELMAIYKGLLLAWELNIKDLWCYSDSEMVIKLITEPVDEWHHYATILINIKEILGKD